MLSLRLYLWQHRKTINDKFVFQVSVRELHNSMVSPQDKGGLKESRDADNNIIIRDPFLSNIIPPLIKHMTSR